MSFWYKISAIFICAGLFPVLVPSWYEVVLSADTFTFGALTAAEEEVKEDVRDSAYFLGDLMLARDVEQTMYRRGVEFPFAGLSFNENSFVVANFESAVPSTHVPTPNNTFRFSTPEKFLSVVASSGVTHISLANNHAFDFGLAGYNNSVTKAWEASLHPFGHPSVINESSVAYINVSGKRIALLALHTLYGQPQREVLIEVLAAATAKSDYQIVYVHWGEEYELVSSPSQRALARDLAALGVDIIIGHHPHVVQEIEQIGNTLVLYSLGNYIFDQYFSPDVQTGLVAKLTLDSTPKLELIPVSTAQNRTQPGPLLEEEQADFLKLLAERSTAELAPYIQSSVLPLDFLLASSTEVVIMTP